MTGDVYKVIELVGTSTISWEDAVKTVVDRATQTLRDLRIAEVKELDVRLENGKIAEHWDPAVRSAKMMQIDPNKSRGSAQ